MQSRIDAIKLNSLEILEEMGSIVRPHDDEITEEQTENERGDDRSKRRSPFHYPALSHLSGSDHQDVNASATYSRYKYYSHLDDSKESKLMIPDHVVPPSFFYPLAPYVQPKGKQGSIVTIFAMWNCMVGTSLLSMPWAIHQAGLFGGIASLILMGLICCYTAVRILKLQNLAGVKGSDVEFSDLCRHLLGRWAEYLSIGSSLLVLLGGAIVYWILMCNFLYHTVIQVYDITGKNEAETFQNHTPSKYDVVCLMPIPHSNHSIPDNDTESISLVDAWSASSNMTFDPAFKEVWSLYQTVPLFLIILIAPLINLKSPTFFTKFNALGTFSVMYLVVFISIKAGQWGLNVSFNIPDAIDHVPYFRPSFIVLTGILALAYFIHNCVISIVRNQRHPQNNVRDVIIAFTLVASTYLCIGVIFYLTFPLQKDCIDDNLLNNFGTQDTFAFVARFFLLFQMLTVYPLLLFIFRAHFMYTVFGNTYPSLGHVVMLNVVLVAICVLFAMYLPHIGAIIRFVGAFCGFVYIFALPSMTYISALNAKFIHAPVRAVLHGLLVLVGLANLICQFFV